MKRPTVAELLRRIEIIETRNAVLEVRVRELELRHQGTPPMMPAIPFMPQPLMPQPPYYPVWVGPETTITGPIL